LAASCYSFPNDKIEQRLLHPEGFRAARMEKDVSDPDSGLRPYEAGAPDTGQKQGLHKSRRGKRRRKKGARPSTPVAAEVQLAPLAPEHPTPQPGPRGNQPRKRRRRSRKPGATPSSVAQQQASDKSERGGRHGHDNGHRRLQARPLPQDPEPSREIRVPVTEPVGTPPPREGAANGKQHHRNFHPDDDGLYAALDLGTNNCRLLVAQPTRPGQFRVVDAFSRIVRLGEGLGASGRLSEGAMERSVEALRICAAKIAAKNIRRMRLIATEACRAAANGEEFLTRVVESTGLELEIINRETEARLAVSGCASLIGREARSAVLFDIGGGSSEIAVLQINGQRSPRLANHITHWTSLPVGVVTLSERHGGRHVTPEIFEDMVQEVGGMLSSFEAPPSEALNGADSGFHMIGTSGTVTTLAGVYLNLPRYDRRQVDGLWMSAEEVTAMQDRLVGLDFDARAANPCIGPDRADLVLAGCAILEAIRRRFPASRMRVADRGLREGLLTEMMADDGVWRRARPRPPFHRSK
jgi:exopolyphosphatase/guanosine-5'-triphosphate,3'-diphosphate pyrophosphatase